ncbi:TraC family protein, partial [Glaesserella parasuis]
RDLIPFRFYDEDNNLFVNSDSVGFIIEAQPLIGANENLVNGLTRMLQNNLPREHHLQVTMLGSQAIQEKLEYGLKDFAWRGEMAEECNRITKNFYLAGAED